MFMMRHRYKSTPRPKRARSPHVQEPVPPERTLHTLHSFFIYSHADAPERGAGNPFVKFHGLQAPVLPDERQQSGMMCCGAVSHGVVCGLLGLWIELGGGDASGEGVVCVRVGGVVGVVGGMLGGGWVGVRRGGFGSVSGVLKMCVCVLRF